MWSMICERLLSRHPVSVGSFSLDVLVSLLRQENAVDICVIKIPDNILYTEYVIVVSGISTRHLKAMALYAVKVVRNHSVKMFPISPCCPIVKYIVFSFSTSILRKGKNETSRLKERKPRTGCASTLVCECQVLPMIVSKVI